MPPKDLESFGEDDNDKVWLNKVPREHMNTTKEFTARSFEKLRVKLKTEEQIWEMHCNEQDCRVYVIGESDIRYLRRALEAPDVLDFLKII
jgi:hypothetical protein